MGARAIEAFVEAERLGGVLGTLRLASMSSVTSSEAGAVDDTPELMQRLERGLARLRDQFQRRAPAKLDAPLASDIEVAAELRRHIRAHLELLARRDLLLDDPAQTIRR